MKLKITVKGVELLFSFFAESEQIIYQSPYQIIPQSSNDTCCAACARMILADSGIDAPESYLASAFETSNGALLSKAPQVLKDFGLPQNYEWRGELNFAELSAAVKKESVIVFVRRRGEIFGHALVIDAIFDNEIRLRDPLPLGEGKSYAVAARTFQQAFFENGETGMGVVYVG